MMTGILQVRRIAKLLSWAVILLFFPVTISKNVHHASSVKAHHFEIVKDQPACFVGGVKVKPSLLKEFRSAGLLPFLQPAEHASKLLPKALLVNISARNTFYSLITINAP